jgi:hypothetical protein
MSMWNYMDVDSEPILDGYPWRFRSDSLRSECKPYWINVVKSFGSQSSFQFDLYHLQGSPLLPGPAKKSALFLCALLIVVT